MRFLAGGGHPVLLAQRAGFPTLLHNDFLFRWVMIPVAILTSKITRGGPSGCVRWLR